MRHSTTWRAILLSFTAALWLAGCAPEGEIVDPDDNEFPLSDLDAILEGAPADRGMSLASDSKADEVLPNEFYLMEYQTPVRNQGSRGTCTIFSSIALMESLYMREGTIANPDFSEQFLQWSVKNEIGAFRNTDGSNNQFNLQAINRHGVVVESLWPYETRAWSTADDPACTGDDRPVFCHTNGEPPEEALAGQRFTLPSGRWINPRAASIRGHLVSTRTPVVVAGDFFYQAWNHGGSQLRTNPANSRLGYVLTPNEEDIADSRMRRAGHGVLFVGFNDNMTVQRVDGEGNPMVDDAGEPVMDRGFFLFKNSWGTGRFGSENPMGDGYGWLSYEYAERYLTAYVAGLPSVRLAEICNDGIDNTFNGLVDCEDPQCADDHACLDPADDYENDTAVAIPDNDPAGVSTTISVTEGGTISSLAVTVDITHTYRGDLRVRLIRQEDGVSVTLHDREGGSADDIQRTFTVGDFNGTDAAGTYELHVADLARQDTGTLNGWRLDITRCAPGDCDDVPSSQTFEDEAGGVTIPDNDPTGISRQIEVDADGQVQTLSVNVEITHPFPSDLTIRFSKVGGREFVLFNREWSGNEDISRVFEVTGFEEEDLRGTWQLTVVDGAAADVGTLDRWSVTFTTR